MVVAPGTQEQGARISPDHPVETERFRVELRCQGQIPDAQMHMPHHRTGGYSSPCLITRCLEQTGQVERVGSHHQLTPNPAPGLSWPIGVDLDSETVGIPEVERFADQVVGGTGSDPLLLEMPGEATE